MRRKGERDERVGERIYIMKAAALDKTSGRRCLLHALLNAHHGIRSRRRAAAAQSDLDQLYIIAAHR